MPNAPVHLLIELAYNAKDFQIVGAPSWANSEGYDVTAKAEGNATFETMRPMLQSLLADRFKLRLHRETRDLPVYELVEAKGGLKIAPDRCGAEWQAEVKARQSSMCSSPMPPSASRRCSR